MEVRRSAKGIGKITKFVKKNNKISSGNVDSDVHTEKNPIKELEFIISRQQKEIKLQHWEIKQHQMEIQQQQMEIKRLKEEMASRDEAAKRCMQQRINEIKDIKAEKIKLGRELDLLKNKAVNLCKEATIRDVRYGQAQKRIDALVKKLKQPSGSEIQQSVGGTQQSAGDTEPSVRATSPKLYRQRPSIGESTPKLVGSRTVASVKINDVTATALLDTGSQVSVVSQSFYRHHFYKDMKPLGNLDVECANGNFLTYLGYITAAVDLPGAATNKPLLCSMLVAPDSGYNLSVPILLGTNVLQKAMDGVNIKLGHRFIKEANIQTPWHLPYTCMLLREKECL